MGTTTEQHHGAATADAAIAAPLLPSSVAIDPPPRNMFAFLCATLASMTTILMGYNLALMSGAELFMREDLGLTDEQVEVLSGSMNIFMLVSILAAGWFADAIGRRGTIVLANAFLMAGALAMSLGATYASLLAARFVTSVGVGFAVVVAPVYAAEIAPASSRGLLSSLVDFFITAGILLSYVSNYALAGLPLNLGWRAMFAMGVLPPILLAAGVLAMPESPRWLAMRRRDGEARSVLERTSDTPEEARHRLDEIRRAVAASDAVVSGAGGVWHELFVSPLPAVRRIVTNVLVLYSFQQASGIDAIVLYSPLVFKAAGISSNTTVLAATIGVGVVKTLSIFVATFLSDRLGRRPLLLASAAAIAVSLTSLGTTLCVTGDGASTATAAACVAAVVAFVAAFSIGLGPVAPTYAAEILPLQLRAQGMSLGIAANRVTCGVLSMTFISLANSITMGGCFFLYASMAVAAWVFVYVRLPETKGRNLEDIGRAVRLEELQADRAKTMARPSVAELTQDRVATWQPANGGNKSRDIPPRAMADQHDAMAAPLLSSPEDGVAPPPPPRRNRFAFVCATLASMTTLFMKEDVGLTDGEIEVLAGSMSVFMLASILAAGWITDRLGRRCTLVLANAFLMAGALAMALGSSFATLMAARFVTSIGAGFARVVAPVYNAEISPPSTRGLLSSMLDYLPSSSPAG
ncbi:hypothetical protein HU200_049003 [Digitaria exilis]|uniref:Major facilitator superfamily (MFS) profile domain-containing protein n=1 Tax=Digitaria exilis TaxID=1010633 RepID=A0A835B5V0_9POAL|nr:hypothetical protein HU200_049003 [Digitaria exilis]